MSGGDTVPGEVWNVLETLECLSTTLTAEHLQTVYPSCLTGEMWLWLWLWLGLLATLQL